MRFSIRSKFSNLMVKWLLHENPPQDFPMCDYDRISYEIRPCDVLLIEGRSRVSEVIKTITQSSWSHAALYIGRLHDIEDPEVRAKVEKFYKGDPNDQLLIESLLGKGTIVSSLANYKQDHIRICRPRGLARQDAQAVIRYAVNRLGNHYDVRQIFDLARFLFPWGIMPRRWRSSLFQENAGELTKESCSTLIAEAFASVQFPVLPVIKEHAETGIELIPRLPRLFTPSDFDYSPFFEIIKYPIIALSAEPHYRNLPWNKTGALSDDDGHVIMPSVAEPELDKDKKKKKKISNYLRWNFRD